MGNQMDIVSYIEHKYAHYSIPPPQQINESVTFPTQC
jgi:hypothetical protein